MKTYHSSELRSMFLKFFKDHGHAVISSASVIPENDPTVLFTTTTARHLAIRSAVTPLSTNVTRSATPNSAAIAAMKRPY